MSNVVIQGGEFSRFAFKLWSYPNYKCTNCYAYGVSQAYVHLINAKATFSRSFFANSGQVHPCDLRNGETPEEQSAVRFEDVQMYVSKEEWVNDCGAGNLNGVKRLTEGKIAPPAPVTNLRAQ